MPMYIQSMPKSSAFVLLLAVVFAAFSGCDSGGPDESASERARLLTAEAWVLQSMEVQPDDGTVEITSFAERYDFEEDGTVTLTFEDGTTGTGAWAFAEGETKLILDAGSQSEETTDLLQLTEADLRFRFSFSAVGRDIVVTTHLVHP